MAFIQGKATVWRILTVVTCLANTTCLIIKGDVKGGPEWVSHAACRRAQSLLLFTVTEELILGKSKWRYIFQLEVYFIKCIICSKLFFSTTQLGSFDRGFILQNTSSHSPQKWFLFDVLYYQTKSNKYHMLSCEKHVYFHIVNTCMVSLPHSLTYYNIFLKNFKSSKICSQRNAR